MLDLATRPDAAKPADKPEKSALVSPGMAATLLAVADAAALAAGCLGVALWREDGLSLLGLYVTVLAIILTLHLQRSARQYDIGHARQSRQAVLRLFGAWSLASAIATAPCVILAEIDADGLVEVAAIVIAGAILGCFMRLVASRHIDRLVRQGYWHTRIVIMGGGEHGQRLVQHLRSGQRPVEIVGLFDDRFDRLPPQIASVPVMGGIEELLAYARIHPIDEVVVALPKGADRRLAHWFQKLAVLPLKVSHCQDIPSAPGARPLTDLFGLPAARLAKKPLDGWGYVLKLIEDRLLASLFIGLTIPLMAVIAIAIKSTSPGPILFRQRRFGFNNNVIEVLKFRSMHVHDGPLVQACRGDPRITAVGRFLRKTSLDELPQLFNVFKGEMSLVGPRPHAVAHNEQYANSINQYLCRHRVKPGITGWAQVNGWRGETDTIEKMEARVAHDLYYIENWSFWLDIKIIMLTIIVGFRHPNAY